ncbi:anthranilate synthase component I family protein [Actinosynnema sp. ALI-1.44]|uniref:anthranilate synthase component I family protein n=1 Tax=Actinosynnema sp. ALI-1.44 TaxID=1933779 RepID=UPI000A010DD3|nr:chorismate-binding protein [Actinosynnema sp. ALI-1.44]
MLVPVHEEFLADALTPVTVFERLCREDEPGFLLESVPVTGDVGRYSYVGHRPRPLTLPAGDPLATLRSLAAQQVAPVPGLPPFLGGAVGYLGWETARHFERLPEADGPAPGLPEAAFLSVEDLAVFDHATRRLILVTAHRPAVESYQDALDRIAVMREKISSPAEHRPVVSLCRADGDLLDGWQSNVTQDEFEARVERAREYIAAGDAFQIVLSQRFSKPLTATPLDLYRHLRAINPSPYMYHLSLGGGRHVVGCSPELLVKTTGRRIETRPLAGTRARGQDLDTDLALEQELLADEKECAEHVMLVDLGRHDLGRVAVPGSVRVEKLMEIERFSHVMHISSTVAGELTDEADGLDALRSTFPAGTLSGAPKIRAMEIIAELEPERRGVYGGALGFVGYDGAADLAIALRTIVVADGKVHVQSGAGVVADSDATAEYRETLHKARAMFTAVRQAEAVQ